jgi:hypothetical protein
MGYVVETNKETRRTVTRFGYTLLTDPRHFGRFRARLQDAFSTNLWRNICGAFLRRGYHSAILVWF